MATPKNDTPQNAEQAPLTVTSNGRKEASGSRSVHFQRELLDQVTASLWLPEWKTSEQKLRAAKAAYDALQGIAPRSELEGMLAAQMLSTHNAAMESLRRAMMESQTFEGRDQNLKHATKLMGLYERQLAALDKHRGKGRQKITVEHVNVHAGGQAIVGNVDGSAPSPSKAAPGQRALSDAPDGGVPLPGPLATLARTKQPARKSSK
tara:strand:- start:27816 stop:28436 length:621 start_codon:yes stop_codon:yes gene_type:complete